MPHTASPASLFRIGIPSKGRLYEKTLSFFEKAGLPITQPGGARHYYGTIAGIKNVEVLFLSADEIADALARGELHFGITGLDLVTEKIPHHADFVHKILPLDFGHADVVVAIPNAWIDVTHMHDLATVAAHFHMRHRRRLRVATKLVSLTQRFFDKKGVREYRIERSIGATEGAPAAGVADFIVDITSSGATLSANHLRILSDGIILKSQACLFASLDKRCWGVQEASENFSFLSALARRILDRIAARRRGAFWFEVKADIRVSPSDKSLLESLNALGCLVPFHKRHKDAFSMGPLILHCPKLKVDACIEKLKAHGAQTVTLHPVHAIATQGNSLYDIFMSDLQKPKSEKEERPPCDAPQGDPFKIEGKGRWM